VLEALYDRRRVVIGQYRNRRLFVAAPISDPIVAIQLTCRVLFNVVFLLFFHSVKPVNTKKKKKVGFERQTNMTTI